MSGWPNLELAVIRHLSSVLPGRVVTRLPSDLVGALPVTRVRRGPGGDDKVTDRPTLDVETFAPRNDLNQLWEVAEQTRQVLHAMAGSNVDGHLVDVVSTASGPTQVNYQNPDVERLVATYRIALRR